MDFPNRASLSDLCRTTLALYMHRCTGLQSALLLFMCSVGQGLLRVLDYWEQQHMVSTSDQEIYVQREDGQTCFLFDVLK